jgi:signal transduction histidine kinase
MEWWQLGMVANGVIAVAYFLIFSAILLPLVRGRQLRKNPHAEDGALALADPSRLSQVLTNLVSNSRKYAEPPYEIHVRRIDDQVHLSVADRGAGVPEEFRPLLFEEFTRGHQDARGTGLGLFVVRSLAEALGGAVEFRPRDGGGSVFTVRLTAA